VPVLVGFWPEEEAILQDDRMRAAVGADCYTSSLQDAVEQCQKVLQEVSVADPPSLITAIATTR
jgi:hypothetical protein